MDAVSATWQRGGDRWGARSSTSAPADIAWGRLMTLLTIRLLKAAVFCGMLALAPPVQSAPVCRTDLEITATDRARASELALRAANGLLQGHGEPLYRAMTEAARTATTASGADGLATMIGALAPYSGVHVERIYAVDLTGVENPPNEITCTDKDDRDRDTTLVLQPRTSQFVVLIDARAINNDTVLSFYLVPEGDGLKVVATYWNATTIGGRSSRDLRTLAVAQASRGHLLNAALLYRIAQSTADRGPNITLAWKPILDREIASLPRPSEYDDAGWTIEGLKLQPSAVNVVGIGKELDLIIDRPTTVWPDDKTVDQESRIFITALVKDHPEFSEVFAGVIVRANKPDGTGSFGTVYDFAKGFDR
jgi:hypothetical protein